MKRTFFRGKFAMIKKYEQELRVEIIKEINSLIKKAIPTKSKKTNKNLAIALED